MPKARNLLAAIAAVMLMIAAALVIAQDQETLRVKTTLAATDSEFPQYLARQVASHFTDALEAAARRGVDVRIVLDAIGAKNMDPANIDRLQRAGVKIGWFNPIASFSVEQANFRTHRKALAVDGDVAFVGGIGIADQWAHDLDGQKRWRDTQIEVRGPAALNVEAGFNENWIETGGSSSWTGCRTTLRRPERRARSSSGALRQVGSAR